VCNLYSITKGQQAIRQLAGAMLDRTGNLPPLPGIFPDYSAPIVRNQPDGRELSMARWGMPSPVFALKGRNSDPGVTNVRNVSSPHWRRGGGGAGGLGGCGLGGLAGRSNTIGTIKITRLVVWLRAW
jgi:putative SOS response-associated peptidase YedK